MQPEPNTAHTPNEHAAANLERRIMAGISIFLAIVILAPVVLSGQDLYHWANTERGLNLAPAFAALAPIALDLAAVVCIGMVIVAAIVRRERPGLFGLLIWVFAGVSAYAQNAHGLAERTAGRAQDAYWFFPAIALLGPLLLEAALHRIRKWARQDAGEQQHGAAGFGNRWLPGVAFRETLAAWAASRREGISRWEDAVAFVRERNALSGLPRVDAVRYAVDALRTNDPYDVRVWLQSRGVSAEQEALDEVFAQLANTPNVIRGTNTPAEQTDEHPADTEPTTEANEPRTPVATTTERAPANVRPFVRRTTPPSANGSAPATDEQVAFVERSFPGVDWRTNTPSARDLSRALGKSSTTPGNNLRKALIARAASEATNQEATP